MPLRSGWLCTKRTERDIDINVKVVIYPFKKSGDPVSLFKTEPSWLNLAYFSCRICRWPHVWAILSAIGGSCLVLRVMLTRSLQEKKAPKALSSRLWGTGMRKILHFSEDVLALKNKTFAVWVLVGFGFWSCNWVSESLGILQRKHLSRSQCNFWAFLAN